MFRSAFARQPPSMSGITMSCSGPAVRRVAMRLTRRRGVGSERSKVYRASGLRAYGDGSREAQRILERK